jgi:hypothetical protein
MFNRRLERVRALEATIMQPEMMLIDEYFERKCISQRSEVVQVWLVVNDEKPQKRVRASGLAHYQTGRFERTFAHALATTALY